MSQLHVKHKYKGLSDAQLRDLALTLRRDGLCCADIADELFVNYGGLTAVSQVHRLLANAPRRLRYGMGAERVQKVGKWVALRP